MLLLTTQRWRLQPRLCLGGLLPPQLTCSVCLRLGWPPMGHSPQPGRDGRVWQAHHQHLLREYTGQGLPEGGA